MHKKLTLNILLLTIIYENDIKFIKELSSIQRFKKYLYRKNLVFYFVKLIRSSIIF